MSYRYLGNKARLASWIVRELARRLPPGASVADPMCGTATMSAAFADHGFKVFAADQLRFPTLHAKARLLHDGRRGFGSSREYLKLVNELNAVAPIEGYFFREFSDAGYPRNGSRPRKYFTGSNAAKIDAMRSTVAAWRSSGLDRFAADVLLHDLILGVNRVANIAGTYGYYRSKWNASSLTDISLIPSPTRKYEFEHTVQQAKVEDLASVLAVDAVYLDPPYTKRQYGGNYHILETIAQEDEPEPVGEGGLRDWYPQASDFCYRRRAREAFMTTLSGLSVPWVFISYSEDAHLDSAEMLELLEAFGTVTPLALQIDRFRSNSRVAKEGAVYEHLYVLEMRNAGAVGNRRAVGVEVESERPLQHRTLAFG